MRFGICIDATRAKRAKAIGFDYVEGNLSSLAQGDDGNLRQVAGQLEQAGIFMETCNCFFPGERIRLVGPDADFEQAAEYGRRALWCAKVIGVRVAVVGSGGARRIPNGFEPQRAEEQMHRLVAFLGDRAAEYGLAIALEPLNRKETNLFVTVAETARFCQTLAHPNVFFMADLYHMVQNGENLGILREYGSLLRHVHVCNPLNRKNIESEDEYDYAAFFSMLRELGYDGRVSIEAGGIDMESDQTAQALNILKGVSK